MVNLIKAEFYKLIRSRVFKIALLTIICLSFLSLYWFFYKNETIMIFNDELNGRNYGFWVNNFKDKYNPSIMEIFYSTCGFCPVLIILVLFLVGSVFTDEYTKGTIKNLVGYGHNRFKIYFVKLIILCFSIFLLIFLLISTTILLSKITGFIKNFSLNEIIKVLKYEIMLATIFTAIVSFYLCLSCITKSKSIIVGGGILYIFLSFIYLGRFVIQKYTPTFMLMDICIKEPNIANVYHIVLSCITLTIITSLIGGVIFKKEDIKYF